MGEHDGHRERMRERFDEKELRACADQELLEMLLCFALPRRDVMPLVRQLLGDSGGLAALLDRTPEELMEVRGIGPAAAVLIALAGEASRRSGEQRRRSSVLNTPSAVREYIKPRLRFARPETAYAVCLDESLRPLSCAMISGAPGDLAARTLSLAADNGSRAVVIAAGAAEDVPSVTGARLALARDMCESLEALGITLLDYIRIHGDFYASAAELGELRTPSPLRSRYHAPITGIIRRPSKYKVETIY